MTGNPVSDTGPDPRDLWAAQRAAAADEYFPFLSREESPGTVRPRTRPLQPRQLKLAAAGLAAIGLAGLALGAVLSGLSLRTEALGMFIHRGGLWLLLAAASVYLASRRLVQANA